MTKQFSEVKDSGTRQQFSTGSVRDTREGKGRFDLISPYGLLRLAQHYENGAKKYGNRNWEKGQPLSRYLDSALRHGNCVLMGKQDEDHLAAMAWNVFAIIHTQVMIERGILPQELDDLPKQPTTIVIKDATITIGKTVLSGTDVHLQCDGKHKCKASKRGKK